MARIPAGSTAARYPPLPLISLSSRIGSPLANGVRAIDPISCSMPFGRCFFRMKLGDAVAVDGQACQRNVCAETAWPMPISLLATSTSSVGAAATGGGAGGGSSDVTR
jgi:hypothetical protein